MEVLGAKVQAVKGSRSSRGGSPSMLKSFSCVLSSRRGTLRSRAWVYG